MQGIYIKIFKFNSLIPTESAKLLNNFQTKFPSITHFFTPIFSRCNWEYIFSPDKPKYTYHMDHICVQKPMFDISILHACITPR